MEKMLIDEEHPAWLDIFEELQKLFNVSSDQLNSNKYRRLFCLIERWAWTDRKRRDQMDNPEEYLGCLWNGEEL